MKKKGLVAMGLAGVMTIGMCVPVLAQDISKGTDSGSLTISLDQPVKYTVTIPADMSITDGNTIQEITVGIKDYMLELDKKVEVELGGTGLDTTDNTLTLVDKGNSSSEIKATLDTVEKATLDSSNTSKIYKLTPPDEASITNAGHYSGTINFTIKYTGASDL